MQNALILGCIATLPFEQLAHILNWFSTMNSSLPYLKSNPKEMNSLEQIHFLLESHDLKSHVLRIKKFVEDKALCPRKQFDSLDLAINDVMESLNNIQIILFQVKQKQEYHDTIYFKTWRSTQCIPLLHKLKISIETLNIRWKDLVSISQTIKIHNMTHKENTTDHS